MTEPHAIESPLASYRNDRSYPFCPGCGHGPILDHLNAALVSLQIPLRDVVIVSDIGCAGLSDQYFDTHAFHGLHGRSLTYATGIKLARPELKVIVIMGDGGTGIGGAHLITAARRNIGLTVLVFNNFNFGMTGGQHSTTTPPGGITPTTPGGNIERPLDICATVAANGAGWVYRGTNFDKDLGVRIAEAIESESFALLDVWELCTAYYVPRNKSSKRTLSTTLEQLGLESGLLHSEARPEYATGYRLQGEAHKGQPVLVPPSLTPEFEVPLDSMFRIVVAGSAGGKVRSATRTLAQAAILSGLRAAQRDDYPITIMTGHSVSELVLSPDEIDYTGIVRPDVLILLSEDGRGQVKGALASMEETDRVFVIPALAEVETGARVTVIDPDKAGVRVAPASVSLFVLSAVIAELNILASEALQAAVRMGAPARVEQNLEIIGAGMDASSSG